MLPTSPSAYPSIINVINTMLNQLCVHTPVFFSFFSLIGYYKVFPVLYRRSLLVIYFIYVNGSEFMLTLNNLSFLPPRLFLMRIK